MPEPIIALNTNDLETAEKWASILYKEVKIFKIGIPLLFKYGIKCIERISRYGKLFLDLKLHDIPSVISLSLSELENYDLEFITVHATSGYPSVHTAVDWAKPKNIKVLAVTVLTSIDEDSTQKIFRQNTTEAVLNLAELSLQAGVDGIVCSGNEVEPLRRRFGNEFLVVTPGFRLNPDQVHDQARVLTPEHPALKHIDYIVMGRAITHSPHPLKTIKRVKLLIT